MKTRRSTTLLYFLLFVASALAQEIPTNYGETIRAAAKLHSWSVNLKQSDLSDALQTYLASHDVNDSSLVLSHLTNAGISNIIQGLSPSADGISDKCLNATEAFRNGVTARQFWALQMVDAIGKPASSILYDGRFTWLGSYRECVHVSVNSTIMNVGFGGKYCFASTPYTLPKALGRTKISLNVGLCMPDVCNNTETITLLYDGLNTLSNLFPQLKLNVSAFNFNVNCKNPDRPLDTRAIVAIVIIMIFVLTMTTATLFDIYLVNQSSVDVNTAPQSNGVVNADQASGDLFKAKLNIDEHAPLVNRERDLAVKVERHEQGFCAKLLLSFSVYTNARKLLATHQTSGTLRCVNGIRFLSMSWVILGHTYVFATSLGNLGDYKSVLKRWTFQAILSAPVSVDSFFVLSGLLVTYLGLKEMKKNDGKFKWVLFYVHRYWRLTPAYMLVMMVYVCILPYLSEGPIWPESGDTNCHDWWWTNMLYINNFVHSQSTEMCMPWSWYLANDMQFYVISPLILLPLYKFPVIGYILLKVLTLMCMILSGVFTSVYHFGPGLMEGGAGQAPGNNTDPMNVPSGWEYLYARPYTRISAYLAGMLFGYLLYKTNCRARMHWGLALLGWIFAAFFCLSTVYGLYDVQDHPLSNDVNALYNATFRFVWSLGLGWVIFACVSGYGGPVNVLLSWRGFVPLSRLTYCAYLVHPAIMILYYNSQETLTILSDINAIYLFFGHMVASYSVAFVMSLMFESPMLGLEKAVLGKLS